MPVLLSVWARVPPLRRGCCNRHPAVINSIITVNHFFRQLGMVMVNFVSKIAMVISGEPVVDAQPAAALMLFKPHC